MTWAILFAGGKRDRARGKDPEEAARRIVTIYFGRRAKACRIAGRYGEPGAFEAVGAGGKPITVFDIDREGTDVPNLSY